MKNLWRTLSHIGVDNPESLEHNREIILLNRTNALIAITMIVELILEVVLWITDINSMNISTLRIALIAILCVGNMILCKHKKFALAKVLLIVFMPFLLFLFPIIVGFYAAEIYLWYPYAAIAFSVFPLLVLRPDTDKRLVLFSVLYMSVYVFLVDLFALAIGVPNFVSYDTPRLVFTKLAQAGIFSVLFFSIYYLIKTNRQFEKHIVQVNEDITDKSNLLQQQAEELREQNNLLNESREELRAKNEELCKYQLELSTQNEELKLTMQELQATQTQLIQSEKMASLGVLTAGIAHEINNPINYISTGVDGLKVLYDDTVELTKDKLNATEAETNDIEKRIEILQSEASILVGNIDKGIKRTTDIIRGLSKFSRLESNKLELCDINENIDTTLALVSGQYRDRITIVKNYSELPKIFCFPSSLGQIIINLVTNAIQAIPENGVITLSSKLNEKFICIEVADTGVGIPDHLKSKIFEPFYTSKGVGKGTGLGLSITYGLVQKLKGSIELNSLPGKGSAFKVYIPLDLEKQLTDSFLENV